LPSYPYYQDIQDGEQWPKGSPFLYSNGFPIGKAKLMPVAGERNLSNPEGYSFQLVQRPSLFQSGQLSSRSDSLRKVSEKPHLEMNPDDAQRLKIEDGEVVQVTNQKGQSLKMNVEYSSRPALGVITAPLPARSWKKGTFFGQSGKN